MKFTALVSCIFLLQAGCDPTTKPQSPAKTSVRPPNYQRFIPVPREANLAGVPWSGSLALDTLTGQLCKTYDLKTEGWRDLVSCFDLYYKTPKTQDQSTEPGQ